MAKKYYAVVKGKSGVPLILESWPECQKEVIGAKGAIYKSFATKEEAISFIKLHLEHAIDSCTVTKTSEETQDDNRVHIYVDGSFMEHKGNYSYGLVVVKNNEVLHEDNGVGYDSEAIALRNVSGEVEGAMKAVDYAISKGYGEVVIGFDYQGIESWALGTWKRNNRITQNYNEFMSDRMKKVKISFKKIKGHSGDKFNDRADALAKLALEKI